jgi:NAD(P)-dependent dehydrogenase (short-subunit alcohol dehydrogenase family)
MAMLSFGKLAVGAAVAVLAVLVHRATGGVYQPPSMHGKTVLITGGTTGLGLESAKRLAQAGAQVIVTARSDARGQAAVEAIQESTKGKAAQVSYRILHLDDLESTKAAALWDLPPIDVLLLNAGVMGLPTLQNTSLGIEKQMHTNHLGHFVFTASVKPFLTRNARIVVVSSLAHLMGLLSGGLDLDYAWKPTEQNYNPGKSYGMSKLANIYFASKLDAISGYTVVSLHPGTVATDIARELTTNSFLQKLLDTTLMPLGQALGIFLSPEQGANTQVYLASTHDPLIGGAYYDNMKPWKLAGFATDQAQADLLWKQSEELSGVNFTF